MAVPSFQEFMLPFLEFIQDGKEHRITELFPHLAQSFQLTDEDCKEVLPSGKGTRFRNRVYWARVYLGQGKLLDATGRGRFRITKRGLDVLAQKPQKIDIRLLSQFPEFVEFRGSQGKTDIAEQGAEQPIETQVLSPEEQLESSYQLLRHQLAQTLIEQVKKSDPAFFEQLVVDLLVAMGYGGSRADAGQAIGQSNDGGIDGIIKEDRLGLDIVYLQAKRWENAVGSPEVRNFTGSLEGHGAQKGVLITTSRFSRDAREFAQRLQQKKIVLIDGEELASLMIDFGVGVSNVSTYVVKKIDPDYFESDF